MRLVAHVQEHSGVIDIEDNNAVRVQDLGWGNGKDQHQCLILSIGARGVYISMSVSASVSASVIARMGVTAIFRIRGSVPVSVNVGARATAFVLFPE